MLRVQRRAWLRATGAVGTLLVASLVLAPSPAFGLGFAGEFGSSGSADGEFNFTNAEHQDTTVDAAGSIWVVDGDNHRVQKFSPTGQYLDRIGVQGWNPGEFQGVRDVAVDPTGNVWALDATRAKVLKFTASGAFINEFGAIGFTPDVGTFNNPQGLDVDWAGNIYVTDVGRQRVIKFTPTGGYVAEATAYGTDVAVSGSHVWVADYYNDRVLRYTTALDSPVSFGASGGGSGEFLFPLSIALDGAGGVLIADSGNNRLVRLSSTGAWLGTITQCCAGDNWDPVGVGAANGQVFVTNKTTSGTIRDTVVRFGTESPTAAFSWAPAAPLAGDLVTFTADAIDPDGTIVAFAWDFDGDGQYDDGTGSSATWTFGTAGSHVVRLLVTDDDGAQATATGTVTVGSSTPTTTATPQQPPTSTTVTPIGPKAPGTAQMPKIVDGCLTESAITVGSSIVRGCFVGTGDVVTSETLEVDGMIFDLPDGSTDVFVIDKVGGTVKTKNATTRVVGRVRTPTSCTTIATMGELRRGSADGALYRLKQASKGALIAAPASAAERTWRFTSATIRQNAGVTGEVVLTGPGALALLGSGVLQGTVVTNAASRCIVPLKTRLSASLVRLFDKFEFEQLDLTLMGHGGFQGAAQVNIAGQMTLRAELNVAPASSVMRLRGQNLTLAPFVVRNIDIVEEFGTTPTDGVSENLSVDFELGYTTGRTLAKGTGTFRYAPAQPWRWIVDVPSAEVLQFANLPTPPSARFKMTGARYVEGGGDFSFGSSAWPFRGKLEGWMSGPSTFNLEGSGVFTSTGSGASGLLSSTGAGACTRLQTMVLGKVVYVDVGIARRWTDALFTVFAAGCDLSAFRTAKPVAAAAQVPGTSTFTLPAGLPAVAIAVGGAGAAPQVDLAGPGGRSVALTTEGTRIGPTQARVFTAPGDATTYLVIGAPGAGTWTVTPREGSAPIVGVDVAHGLPDPGVRATVTRKGRTRTLRYRLTPIEGQSVTFAEEGRDVRKVIGVAKGARGALRFRPATGPKGRRRIIAIVTQDGRPRQTDSAGSYLAPGPPPVKVVRRIRIVRTPTAAVVTWPAVKGASAYEVTFRPRGRPRYVLTSRRPKARLALPDRRARGTVAVRVVDRAQRLGRPRTAAVPAAKARKKR